MKNTLSKQVRMSPFCCCDGYKLSHHLQYPDGIDWVYSNFTPRKSRTGDERFVFFGLQAALLKINDIFQRDFFDISEEDAVADFAIFYKRFFGADDYKLYERIRYVHQLGYLPLSVFALAEGTVVTHGIPVFTITNTDYNCFWLTNWIETWLSCELWKPCTSATTAFLYRETFDRSCKETSTQDFMPAFQGHDFSMRGLSGVEDAKTSGAAHLVSFNGTDTCPALNFIDQYYPDSPGYELLGTSVPATEHSVMSAGGKESEIETFRRLLKTYPTGILSVVSDTWDFWKVVTEYLPLLKDEIMARDGKLVIRPDSSPKTPVEMIIGDKEATPGSPEYKGLIECLYDLFGGTTNVKEFIELDPHIGAIYGDSITREYQSMILEGLKQKGFASTNIVLGIGSYTYQYVTRDTHGIAIKATAIGLSNGVMVPIFKDPKTDNSGKKSAKGVLQVKKGANGYELVEYHTLEDINENWHSDEDYLKRIYHNGQLDMVSFSQVRKTLKEHATTN